METFNVVCIVPVNHLTDVLKRLESLKIPYNVELRRTVRKPNEPRTVNGVTNKDFILDRLSKGPLTVRQLGDAFMADGRKRQRMHGPLFQLKKAKLIKQTKDGLALIGAA